MCVVFILSSPNQINWLRVDEDVPPHAVVTGSDLYIENLNKSYNGTYRCVASNSIGEAYDDYILYVYGRFWTCGHSGLNATVVVSNAVALGVSGTDQNLRVYNSI